MSSTLQRAASDSWETWDSAQVMDLRPRRVEVTQDASPRPGHCLGRRVLSAVLRFLITLGIGVVGTLAWQAYGDDARQVLAVTYPDRLGWIAPQPAPAARAASRATLASAAPTVPSPDQQQLNSLSLNLAAVRQSVEQLATQVASVQQQMSGEIARLEAAEQDILSKVTPRPRPASLARKPPVRPSTAVSPAAASAAQGR